MVGDDSVSRDSRLLLPFRDRKPTVAKSGFSGRMVPPVALFVHLCIGQAYAFKGDCSAR